MKFTQSIIRITFMICSVIMVQQTLAGPVEDLIAAGEFNKTSFIDPIIESRFCVNQKPIGQLSSAHSAKASTIEFTDGVNLEVIVLRAFRPACTRSNPGSCRAQIHYFDLKKETYEKRQLLFSTDRRDLIRWRQVNSSGSDNFMISRVTSHDLTLRGDQELCGQLLRSGIQTVPGCKLYPPQTRACNYSMVPGKQCQPYFSPESDNKVQFFIGRVWSDDGDSIDNLSEEEAGRQCYDYVNSSESGRDR